MLLTDKRNASHLHVRRFVRGTPRVTGTDFRLSGRPVRIPFTTSSVDKVLSPTAHERSLNRTLSEGQTEDGRANHGPSRRQTATLGLTCAPLAVVAHHGDLMGAMPFVAIAAVAFVVIRLVIFGGRKR